jgi:peptide/nickel transport system substrate-binding protein
MRSMFGGTRRIRAGSARRRLLFLALPLAASLIVGATAAASTHATKPVLTIANSSLNACIATKLTPLVGDYGTSEAAYEPLIIFHGYNKPFTSNVLTSWKVSPGNKVFTMTLKPNIRFDDGTLLDAAAVKTWVDWRSKQAGANFGNTYMAGPVASTTVLSKYTVQVKTESPNPNFELGFSQVGQNWGEIVSPKAVAKLIANPASPVFTEGTYGFGPYMLDASNTVIGDHCTYVPNPYYYNKAKQIWSKVIVKLYADPTSELAAVETGQADTIHQGSPTIANAAKAAGLKVYAPPNLYTFLWFRDHDGNVTPAIKDVRVRQAMSYAIDRKALLNSVFSGVGGVTSSPDPGSDGDNAQTTNYFKYDPAKAKQLLAAAGYPNGFTLQVFSPQGGFGFSLDAETSVLCKFWGDVGINCNIHSVPASTAVSQLFTRQWDVAVFLDAPLPVSLWYPTYMLPTSVRGDQWGWTDPVTEKLYRSAVRGTAAQAAAAWHQILLRVTSQAFAIGLTVYPNLTVSDNRVGGAGVPYSLITDWTYTGK